MPHPSQKIWPIIIVGAGAAGMLAAIHAARQGLSVLLLETRRQPGAKIRASGGGRCNILPENVALDDFFSSGSMHTVRNVIMGWPLASMREFFEEDLKLALKTEANGKVFPQSDDARDVVAALLSSVAASGATLRTQTRVTKIQSCAPDWDQAAAACRFVLTLDDQTALHAQSVIVCTGGLSMPRTGSDGHGMTMAHRLGHHIEATAPALVPLLLHDEDFKALSGLSAPMRLWVKDAQAVRSAIAGEVLFTHRGISGPAALNISRHITADLDFSTSAKALVMALVEDAHTALAHAAPHLFVSEFLRQRLPKRLADALHLRFVGQFGHNHKLAELPRSARHYLVRLLQDLPLNVAGSEGYKTAEVTLGGVSLNDVVAKTLMSRRCPGLYFAGEVLDATGKLGGYNFLWAWASGRRAGLAAAQATLALDLAAAA